MKWISPLISVTRTALSPLFFSRTIKPRWVFSIVASVFDNATDDDSGFVPLASLLGTQFQTGILGVFCHRRLYINLSIFCALLYGNCASCQDNLGFVGRMKLHAGVKEQISSMRSFAFDMAHRGQAQCFNCRCRAKS